MTQVFNGLILAAVVVAASCLFAWMDRRDERRLEEERAREKAEEQDRAVEERLHKEFLEATAAAGLARYWANLKRVSKHPDIVAEQIAPLDPERKGFAPLRSVPQQGSDE